MHEGSCGFNAEPRSLVVRITKQGYYWPSMHREVAKAIQDYEKCKEQSVIRKARTSRTLPRNSQKETPFSLTYGSETMIPIIKTTDDRGRVQKVTNGKESKEVASIEKVPKVNLLLKVAQYIFPQLKATHEPSLIKLIKESDLSPPKTSNMRKTIRDGKGFTRSTGGDIVFEDGVEDRVAFWEEGTCI
ncbi:hypothetical protein Tco_0386846 [Tanacetum coccineum]